MAEHSLVITIDGPSGVGKGSVSQLLAQTLGWHLLDSGALYRVVALAAMKRGVELDNETTLAMIAEHLDVQFKPGASGEPARIIFEGNDVTDEVRTEKQGNLASKVAKLPHVRDGLFERQRAFSHAPGLIAEGRDMGTIVFPEAKLKFFLTASAEERANRRFQQLKDKGINVKIADLVTEIAERDQRDRTRAVAPLVPAKDAVLIDTTHLNIHDVLSRVLMEVKQAGLLGSV